MEEPKGHKQGPLCNNNADVSSERDVVRLAPPLRYLASRRRPAAARAGTKRNAYITDVLSVTKFKSHNSQKRDGGSVRETHVDKLRQG